MNCKPFLKVLDLQCFSQVLVPSENGSEEHIYEVVC